MLLLFFISMKIELILIFIVQFGPLIFVFGYALGYFLTEKLKIKSLTERTTLLTKAKTSAEIYKNSLCKECGTRFCIHNR